METVSMERMFWSMRGWDQGLQGGQMMLQRPLGTPVLVLATTVQCNIRSIA